MIYTMGAPLEHENTTAGGVSAPPAVVIPANWWAHAVQNGSDPATWDMNRFAYGWQVSETVEPLTQQRTGDKVTHIDDKAGIFCAVWLVVIIFSRNWLEKQQQQQQERTK